MVGTIRALIKLALVVLVVHAAVRVVPPFWNYVKFRDACEEIARFSAKRSAEEVAARVMTKAGQLDIPLDQSQVQVRKQGNVTYIDAAYTARLEYLPTKFYPYDFVVTVHGTPPTYEALP
ncbi:MAG: hypothetical protein MUF60_03805 [Vicinamibacterales bacterium]|nr:hypothetical protein [Vicinamibacterales bacterium]